ncbi:MAG TPA: hypothetical protein VFX33_00030 [Actinomycetales bacterium]|nr:hypothetical protein [Actinomycetales bacterium]
MSITSIALIVTAALAVTGVIVALWRTLRSGGSRPGTTGTPYNGPRHVESDWASSGPLPSRPYRTVPRLP